MASKSTSPARLFLAVLMAVLVFVGLALAENQGRQYLDRRASSQRTAAAEKQAKQVVVRYTGTLIKAYDATKPTLLEGSATDRQIDRVKMFMAYNHFDLKQKLVADLIKQKFGAVKKKGKKATVRAVETWGYRYLDEKNGSVVQDATETLRVTYQLRKEKSRWLVDSLEAKPVK